MKISKKVYKSHTVLLVIIIIFLLFLIGFLTYSLKEVSKYQESADDKIGASYFTENLPENSVEEKTNNLITFTHPTLGYTVEFPSNWNPQLFTSPAGRSVQLYRDLIIYSPDYDKRSAADTSLSMQKNASILIRAVDTPYKDVEDKFKDNLAAQKIARDIVRIDINGTPAIQYDYSFKNENATAVTMVKDGRWYFIKFQYDNEEVKREYIDTFKNVLNSLKLD